MRTWVDRPLPDFDQQRRMRTCSSVLSCCDSRSSGEERTTLLDVRRVRFSAFWLGRRGLIQGVWQWTRFRRLVLRPVLCDRVWSQDCFALQLERKELCLVSNVFSVSISFSMLWFSCGILIVLNHARHGGKTQFLTAIATMEPHFARFLKPFKCHNLL